MCVPIGTHPKKQKVTTPYPVHDARRAIRVAGSGYMMVKAAFMRCSPAH
jgi:hypothetical protein